MKILYLYSGAREKIYDEYQTGVGPDTDLLGLNYMNALGSEASFVENKWTRFFRKLSFELTYVPLLFRVKNYDVVYAGSGLLLLFLVKFVLRFQKPVWVIHNSYLCRLLRNKKRGTVIGFCVRKMIAYADAIVSPVRPQEALLVAEGVDPQKHYFIHYGVDGTYFNVRPEGPRIISGRYIVSVGRDLGRDYVTLLDAVRGLDVPTVIGALPRNFPTGTVIPPYVRVDFFSKEQMKILLHDAEFVVVPTFPEETTNGSDYSGQTAILEAMMAGKAVVTSSFTEDIVSEENGILVPTQDASSLQRAIFRLWSDPAEAVRMGKANAEKARTFYTTKVYAEKLHAIFQSVVEKGQRK